jgi:large subunit ribosomal protein L33
VLIAVVEPEQLAVVEPVLLPGGRRVRQVTLRLCLHQVLPPLRALPGGLVKPQQRDRTASELAGRTPAIVTLTLMAVAGAGDISTPAIGNDFHSQVVVRIMSRSTLRPVIKLRSTAGTGYTYVTRKSRKNDPDRLVVRKYDPVIGRHIEFREER